MRTFRHLSDQQRRSLVVGLLSDEPKLSIARRLSIDNSTVHYHAKKLARLTREQLHALIQPPCAPCGRGHISFKCLVCGTAHDNVKSEEFGEIRRLRGVIADLERLIALYEPDRPSVLDRPSPVVAVRL